MARNSNDNDDGKINPASVTNNVKSAFKHELVKELLNGSFQDNKTKLGNDTLSLIVEVAKCLVTETCLRASNQALRENCDKVDIEHVEKCLPQLSRSRIAIEEEIKIFLSQEQHEPPRIYLMLVAIEIDRLEDLRKILEFLGLNQSLFI